MPNWVALLRGVNVGGNNKLAMADLRQCLADEGLDDVRTYIQSGNVVFQSPLAARKLESVIRESIKTHFGYDVPILVISKSDLQQRIAGNPFPDQPPATLYATLLDKTPAIGKVRALEQVDVGPDRFVIVKRTAYLNCPQGYSRTKLTNPFFEKGLGVATTSRNWRTLNQIAAMID